VYVLNQNYFVSHFEWMTTLERQHFWDKDTWPSVHFIGSNGSTLWGTQLDETKGTKCQSFFSTDSLKGEFNSTGGPAQEIVTFHQPTLQIPAGIGSGICNGCSNHEHTHIHVLKTATETFGRSETKQFHAFLQVQYRRYRSTFETNR
jgi:hypothetical protein